MIRLLRNGVLLGVCQRCHGRTLISHRLLVGRSAASRLPRTKAPAMAVESHPSTSARSADEQLLSVAPMMDWTDIHYRQLARLLSRHTWLYTEMVVDTTLVHNPHHDRFLWFPLDQRPVVCQLGGSDPKSLAAAAKFAAAYGYDEININCGCPSDKVAGAGCFGASLMLRPGCVAAACRAMADAVDVPVTVKCRLGVDDADSYEQLCAFVEQVSRDGGVTHFIVHARKCILKGLSPAQNRSVPPIRHEWVFALLRDFPHLRFSLNGVVGGCHEAAAVLATRQGSGRDVHGVMIGRAAYERPWDCLSDADRSVFGASENPATSRRQVLEDYGKYGDSILGRFGTKPDGHRVPNVRAVVKPLLGLFHGERNSKKWKAALDRAFRTATSVSGILQDTIGVLPPEVLDAPPKQLPVLPSWKTLPELPAALAMHPRDGVQNSSLSGQAGAPTGNSGGPSEAAPSDNEKAAAVAMDNDMPEPSESCRGENGMYGSASGQQSSSSSQTGGEDVMQIVDEAAERAKATEGALFDSVGVVGDLAKSTPCRQKREPECRPEGFIEKRRAMAL